MKNHGVMRESLQHSPTFARQAMTPRPLWYSGRYSKEREDPCWLPTRPPKNNGVWRPNGSGTLPTGKTDPKAPTTPQKQGLKLDLYKTYFSALKRDAQMVKTGKPAFSSFILEFHVLQIKTNGPLNVSRAVCHTMTPRV